MKIVKRNAANIGVLLVALIVGLSAVAVLGQEKQKEKVKRGFCESHSYWSGDNGVQFKELREMTTGAGSEISVDGNQNGGISVIGEDRSDVLVRACIQAWGTNEESSKAAAGSIRVNLSGTIKAEGPSDGRWSVSYEIRAPRGSNLNLRAKNGGIHVKGISGSLDVQTVNGGVHLNDVAGTVKGRTTNGGIHVNLVGGSWKGSGLDVETTNGGVHLNMPANFAARVDASTVNGGFHSDFAGLQPEKESTGDGYYRHRPKKVTADINGGGPLVRVVTTNGGVHINSQEN